MTGEYKQMGIMVQFPFFKSRSSSNQSIDMIGNTYSFKTKPYTDFGERDTLRYAALKVVEVFENGRVCVVVLDGIFRHPISARDLKGLRPLVANRFGFDGKLCAVTQPPDKDHTLDEFTFIANKKLSIEEKDGSILTSMEVGASHPPMPKANGDGCTITKSLSQKSPDKMRSNDPGKQQSRRNISIA